MKTTSLSEGIANWERLKAFVATAEAADPSLARRNDRFRRHLAAEQRKARERIKANPDSQEARDYAFAFSSSFC